MNFDDLKHYLTIIEEGSLSKASKRICLSQSALTLLLQRLETELGSTLLIRNKRGISLTASGLVLKKKAEEILQLYDSSRKEISSIEKAVFGEIRIGAGESMAFRVLSKSLRTLQDKHPDVMFHLITGDSKELMYRLQHGLYLDCALVFTSFDHTLMDSMPLPPMDTIGLIMPKDCDLAKCSLISPEQLADLPLIVSRLQYELESSSILPYQSHIVGTYNSVFDVFPLVADGLGYAITFDYHINDWESIGVCFRPIEPLSLREGFLIWKKQSHLTPALSEFLQIVRESLSV